MLRRPSEVQMRVTAAQQRAQQRAICTKFQAAMNTFQVNILNIHQNTDIAVTLLMPELWEDFFEHAIEPRVEEDETSFQRRLDLEISVLITMWLKKGSEWEPRGGGTWNVVKQFAHIGGLSESLISTEQSKLEETLKGFKILV
jgi:hypothetical protein